MNAKPGPMKQQVADESLTPVVLMFGARPLWTLVSDSAGGHFSGRHNIAEWAR
mgnify:CR=1 FL=1